MLRPENDTYIPPTGDVASNDTWLHVHAACLAHLLAVAHGWDAYRRYQLAANNSPIGNAGHIHRVQIKEFEVLQSCSSDSLVKHVKKLGVELRPFFASIDPSKRGHVVRGIIRGIVGS